jgi:hypothetical protein
MAKIDFVKTHENCRLIKVAAIARACEVTPPLVYAVIQGKYRSMEGPKAQRVLDKLRDLHLLVEVPDDGDVDLAA